MHLNQFARPTVLLSALVALHTAAAAAAPHAYGPAAAQAALKDFTVAPGLEVTLFASEPMVRNPTDMDIDAQGRVWITEGVNYRSSFQKWGILEPAGDRIIVLADTNRDGAADQETVFYQDPSVNAALGICVLGNRAIVSSSPNIFVLTDTNGDGKADKRELLFTGIGGFDHDHGVHAVVFGPDGKLYFNFGNQGRQVEEPVGSRELPLHGLVPKNLPMKPVVDLDGNVVNGSGHPYRQGMVFRCDPDGSHFETLAWNFRNNYEVCVDSFGTLWQSDNDDDGNRGCCINYVMQYGNFGYVDEITGAGWQTKRTDMAADIPHRHWHQNDPGVIPNLLFTGAGAPAGIILYEGQLLPPPFRGQMIHCDAGVRVVRAYPVQPDGAGYKAESVDILGSSDTWFRPVDVCTAPDGSIYVADWNDAGVGGHYMADQDPATMTGRIYRIAPKGSKPFLPKLNLKSAAGCVAALQSPNLATRYLAWTKLHHLQARAERPLRKLWKGRNARMRARALQLLARIPGKEHKYIQAALKDPDPNLRITGLRIAREEGRDVIPDVQMLVKDPSPQVRRECAIALRHNHSTEAPHLWAQLAQEYHGHDRWYLEALGIGADRQWDAFFDAWLADVGGQWNTPAGRDIVWRSRSQKTPALLVQIISDKNTPASERPRYFRSLDFLKGPAKDAALVQLLTSH
jgi:putative membrane-bound dehydrogenase-like protein